MGTHTYSILPVSQSAFDEMRTKLEAAGYGDAIHDEDGKPVIDMHGLAVQAEDSARARNNSRPSSSFRTTDRGGR